MSITLLVPLLVAIVGALVYALAANAKLVELARLVFFASVLVVLLVAAQHVVRF